MRALISFVSILAALCCNAPQSRAAATVYEGFDYPAGANALASKNGGIGWNNPWDTGLSDIVAGGFNYTDGLGNQLVTVGNRAAADQNSAGNLRFLSNTFSSGTVYLSFLLQCTNSASNFNYAGLSLYSGVAEEIFFGDINAPPNGTLGIERLGFENGFLIGTDASLLNLIVVRIDFNAGTTAGNEKVSIFVDPSLDAEPATAFRFTDVADFSFDRIRIQSGRTSGADPLEIGQFDEIRVGSTYADVTPHTVPEPGACGLAALAGLMLWGRRPGKGTIPA